MPWPAYSERFIGSAVSNAWQSFTVPAGHRAVIKTITSVNNTTEAALTMANIAGILVMDSLVPAASHILLPGLHLVAYAGETFGLYMYAAAGAVSAHGYLLTDSSSRAGPPPAAALQPEWPPPDLTGGGAG